MTRLLAAILLLMLTLLPAPACTALDLSQITYEFAQDLDIEELWEEWLEPGQYMTMLTPDGEVITQTGRRIYEGDEYLTSDNRLYRVVEVKDNLAYTELVEEKVDLAAEYFSLRQIREALGLSPAQAQEQNGKSGLIAIYHTHNAESYVPTDGTDSIDGKGGIHAVGSGFAQSLEKLGVGVEYSENLHLPHDRGAYRRSRNTVLELLAQNPDAIYDVHRDAAPKDAYAANIGDEWITQVQFVVGRQNLNLGVNRQYAQSLKAAADQLYPGLVKGIFYARGNYMGLSPSIAWSGYPTARSAVEHIMLPRWWTSISTDLRTGIKGHWPPKALRALSGPSYGLRCSSPQRASYSTSSMPVVGKPPWPDLNADSHSGTPCRRRPA